MIDRPPDHRPFKLSGRTIGWVQPAFSEILLALGCQGCSDESCGGGGVALDDPAELPALAHRAAEQGAFRWRDEAFDVREVFDGPVLSQIDRGAIPVFGMLAEGVHLNGIVTGGDALHLWVARRSQHKILDPGKLDNLVAGGIGAGATPLETLIKEAGEEAAMPQGLARQAVCHGTISYVTMRPEGLRRDRLHCYDLMLPRDFQPEPRDGEVDAFELWPMQRVAEAVRDGDSFKFNVKLVLVDLLARLGHRP